MEKFHVLGEFVRKPTSVGAVAESSWRLAELITDAAGLERAKVVVEFGPGTGAFTEVILRKLDPGAMFFAIEANASFAAATRKRCPGVRVFHASAVSVRERLHECGQTSCDCIISGLPFSSFSPAQQDEMLAAVHDSLSPGGRFVTFAYLGGLAWPLGRRFRSRLRAQFSEVSSTRTIWRNIPPAFVYRTVK
ncbi:MAG: methyltransferase domain-containing protein [Acidobacteria bacterium]|nr:methyltransferase domain-containing protein [Acidobacteriota bacterium]